MILRIFARESRKLPNPSTAPERLTAFRGRMRLRGEVGRELVVVQEKIAQIVILFELILLCDRCIFDAILHIICAFTPYNNFTRNYWRSKEAKLSC